jgi:hypothetical protein
MISRIAQARSETVALLQKALAYSPEFRKPAQIDFYRAHIACIDKSAAGEPCESAKANLADWDVMQCELDARSN